METTTTQISNEEMENLLQAAKVDISKSSDAAGVSMNWRLIATLSNGLYGKIQIGQAGPMGVYWTQVGSAPNTGVTVSVVIKNQYTTVPVGQFMLVNVNMGDEIVYSYSNPSNPPNQFLQLLWGF